MGLFSRIRKNASRIGSAVSRVVRKVPKPVRTVATVGSFFIPGGAVVKGAAVGAKVARSGGLARLAGRIGSKVKAAFKTPAGKIAAGGAAVGAAGVVGGYGVRKAGQGIGKGLTGLTGGLPPILPLLAIAAVLFVVMRR